MILFERACSDLLEIGLDGPQDQAVPMRPQSPLAQELAKFFKSHGMSLISIRASEPFRKAEQKVKISTGCRLWGCDKGRASGKEVPPPHPSQLLRRTRAALLSAKAARRARASGWVFTTPATTASA